MADWAVAVKAFKVELRTAGIAQFCRIGMRSQHRPIGCYIVSYKLAEDRPPGSGISQMVRRVISVAAIAYPAHAA